MMAELVEWSALAVMLACSVQAMRLVFEMRDKARKADALYAYCISRMDAILGERVLERDRPSEDAGSAEFARWYSRKRSDAFNENKTDTTYRPGGHREP